MKNKLIGVLIAFLIIIAAILTLINFGKREGKVEPSSENEDSLTINITFNEPINTFAFNFYKEFYSEDKGNIFFSPYSIFTALAMTYEGARGETAQEMADVLNIEQDNESFHEYVRNLYDQLNKKGEYNISTANAIWPRTGFHLLENYSSIIKNYYNGEIKEVEYSNPEKAAEIINRWVENKTNHLIKNLVPPDYIDKFTKLVLTNAIYFKGIWKIQFDEKNTTEREFTTSSGKRVKVSMMQLANAAFNYTENNKMQVLELPYAGNDISMLIFLPKDGYGVNDIIKYLDESTFFSIINSMNEREVNIYLPRFKIKTPLYVLNEYLIKMGMPTAFSAGADFSGIDGVGGLYISHVLHKAFIEVNEEGTEAAASTAVIMYDSANPIITFNCNHPFLFMIYHKATNTILFMGNVDNPV